MNASDPVQQLTESQPVVRKFKARLFEILAVVAFIAGIVGVRHFLNERSNSTQLVQTVTENRASVIPEAQAVRLKFVSVDSEETSAQAGYGENAVDGNPDTYWHTQWKDKSPGLPHEIVIELVPPSAISGFTYLPPQVESDHGIIRDYEFYVSNDGKNFGEPVRKGSFKLGRDVKTETFPPVKARFIKLKALSEINGLQWTSAAEIGVVRGERVSANGGR